MRSFVAYLIGFGTICCAAALSAQSRPEPAPPAQSTQYEQLLACRAIADPQGRLECYDRTSAQLESATRSGETMVVDRTQIQSAKRSLFGLSLPNIGKLFGSKDKVGPVGEELESLETTVTSASFNKSGKLRMVVAEGGSWLQIDARSVRTPRPGDKVRIKRAALGSYFASIDGQSAIKMIRER